MMKTELTIFQWINISDDIKQQILFFHKEFKTTNEALDKARELYNCNPDLAETLEIRIIKS